MSTTAVLVGMLIFGVVGFAVAFFILFRRKQRRRETAFYKLVSTLLWVDVSATLGCYPLAIAGFINGRRWIGGDSTCDFFAFLTVFTGQGSSLLITIMAVERYFAIRHPMLHAYYVNSPRSTAVVLVCVLFSFVYACMPFMGVGKYSEHASGTWCSFFTKNTRDKDKHFAISYAVIGAICLFVTNLCNLGALCALVWPRICVKEQGPARAQKTKVSKAEMNMIVLLTGISISLTTCWTPMLTRILVNQFQMSPNTSADSIAIRMASLNQILDPWIYIILRRDMIVQVVAWLRHLRAKKTRETNGDIKIDKSVIVLYSSRRSKTSSAESETSRSGAGTNCATDEFIQSTHI